MTLNGGTLTVGVIGMGRMGRMRADLLARHRSVERVSSPTSTRSGSRGSGPASTGVPLQAGFHRRFDPEIRRARAQALTGELGTLRRLHLVSADA